MAQEDTLRLAAEVVDKWSGPLREMTKSVHALQDMLRGTHTEGSKAAKEQAEQQRLLNERLVESARTVTGFLTPSMIALGLSVGGAGEALKTLIEKLKESGESFFKIQDAMARTGMSAPQLDALVQTMGRFGISIDAARDHASRLGDIAAKLHRQFSPTVSALESTFTDLHPLIDKMSRENAVDANNTFWQYYWSAPVQAAPPDKRRKLLDAFEQDQMFATVKKEQFEKAQAEETARVLANPDLTLKQLEALREAFDHLKGSTDNFWRAMQRAFGDSTISMIDFFAKKMEERAKEIMALKQAWDATAIPWWMGGSGVGKAVPGSPFQPLPQIGTREYPFPEPPADKYSPASRFKGGYMPMSFETGGGDAENIFVRGIKSGTLQALQEWYASLQAGDGGQAGIVRANLGGSGAGGGSRSWGGGGYGVLPDEATGGAGAGGTGASGGAGTRGNRNNNRGNLKFGALAKAFGAVGADERGFAIFPDEMSGDAAQDALIQSNRFTGLTLDEFGNKYAEGSADWKRTVGASLGIGLHDKVNNQDPRLAEAIRKAEGTSGGAPGLTSGTRANLMHGQYGGIGENLQAYRTAGGHTFTANSAGGDQLKGFVEELEAGGAPINSIGGYNPRRIAGSNRWSQHAYGNAIDIDQHARGVVDKGFSDWINAHPAEYRAALSKWGIKSGEDFGDLGHYEWGGTKPDRSLLSTAAKSGVGGSPQKVEGDAHLKVAFENAPAGVQAYMKYGGLFKSGTVDWGHAMPRSNPGGGS
jgi:hypothetical protein